MRPDLGQAVLTVVALGTIALIASTSGPAGGRPAATTTSTTTIVEAADTDSEAAAAPTLAMASDTPLTTTSSEAPAPRRLQVTAYPSDVQATVSMSDESGGEVTGTGSVEADMAGPVTIQVAAEGWRSEQHIVTASSDSLEVYLDPLDQVVDRHVAFITGSAPKQVAFTPDGEELWVTLLAGSGLEVYDPADGDLLAAIDLPEAGSVEVIFDQEGSTAWVSQMETATVYEIDVEQRRIRRRLETGGSWTKVMALSLDERRLWASNWVSNDISEFDLDTGDLVRRLPTVATPRGLATDSDGTRLYVAGYDAGDLAVIDLSTGEGRTIHHSGGAMRHLVADPVTGRIFASDMARDIIAVIEPGTEEVTTLASTDRLPNTIDLTPDGRVLAVSNRGRNNPETYYLAGPEWGSILLLDTGTGEVLDALVGGNQPTGLDISAGGRWLAYSDFLDNRVTVVGLPSYEELVAGGGGRGDTYREELGK